MTTPNHSPIPEQQLPPEEVARMQRVYHDQQVLREGIDYFGTVAPHSAEPYGQVIKKDSDVAQANEILAWQQRREARRAQGGFFKRAVSHLLDH